VLKTAFQIESEIIRGVFLQALYDAGKAVRAKTVRAVLAQMYGLVEWADFILQAEYLVGEQLIRVFPVEQDASDEIEPAQYLAMCKRMTAASPDAMKIGMQIEQRGRRFVEGNEPEVKGVERY